MEGSHKTIIILVVVVLLAIAGGATLMLTNKPVSQEASDARTSTTQSSTAAAGPYKDGTYSASATYLTPGGTEKVDIKVTVASDTVSAVEFTGHPTTREAETYQGQFEENLDDQVVGKELDEINLSRVSGSSLTPNGFNKALEVVKNDAKS